MFLVFTAGVCHQSSGDRVDSRRFLRWRLRVSLVVRRRPPTRPGGRARHLKLQAWRHGLVTILSIYPYSSQQRTKVAELVSL